MFNMSKREELFEDGRKIFGDEYRVHSIVQNPNPDLVDDDISDCYEHINKIIRLKNEEANIFKKSALAWYERLKEAYVIGDLVK